MHAGSSEWVRTHAPPFSRAFVPANDHAPPLVKEISLVVSRSCHLSSLNFQALYFQSLLAHGYELRRAGVAFRRLANHFPGGCTFSFTCLLPDPAVHNHHLTRRVRKADHTAIWKAASLPLA